MTKANKPFQRTFSAASPLQKPLNFMLEQKMNIKPQKWEDIKKKYERGTILLGNGSSIAIHSGFAYSSLLELARQKSLISSEIENIFKYFPSEDFELILRMLLYAYHINKSLKISEDATRNAYSIVKNCLIQSVKNTHPNFQDIEKSLLKIPEFLKFFDTVLSLNYALLSKLAKTEL